MAGRRAADGDCYVPCAPKISPRESTTRGELTERGESFRGSRRRLLKIAFVSRRHRVVKLYGLTIGYFRMRRIPLRNSRSRTNLGQSRSDATERTGIHAALIEAAHCALGRDISPSTPLQPAVRF